MPARNAADDLTDCLESASQFADAVVALDDGSNDDTRSVLSSDPRVAVLLTNPPRPGYEGWDDGANRNRLLQAAARLGPSWVVSLDADERIPPDDATALRDFIATDALPGCAYGLRHFRMWEGGCDPSFTWIYRMFSFAPGQTFPTQPLHFDPVPTQIPRARWVRTTVRVQHFGVVDEAGRLAHVAKYREADAAGRHGSNFGGLAERPTALEAWEPRPAGLSVLSPGHQP